MKNYNLLLITVLIILITGCNHVVTNKDAKLKFQETMHDFGKIKLKKDATFEFMFENTGSTALVIHDVKTSCGCTVPEWPQEIIKPDKSAGITIKYDASHPGVFYKQITVFYNGQDSPDTLVIKGEVEYPSEQLSENSKQ